MGLKTSGETMQSLNNASRRCAHVSAIFSPPGFALPKLGAGREAIVFTTRYVMQQGAKERQTVGIVIPQVQTNIPHRHPRLPEGRGQRPESRGASRAEQF